MAKTHPAFGLLAVFLCSTLATACAVTSTRPLYTEAEGTPLTQTSFKIEQVSGECPEIPEGMVFQKSGRHYDAFVSDGNYAGRLTLVAQRVGYIVQFEAEREAEWVYFQVEPHLRGFRVFRVVGAEKFATQVMTDAVNSPPGAGPPFDFELIGTTKLRIKTRRDLEELFRYARRQGEFVRSCVVALVP